MSLSVIEEIKTKIAILDMKEVQYYLWKEAYDLLTDEEAPKHKELYWELANKVANANVSDIKPNFKDIGLKEFVERRAKDAAQKIESLKSFIELAEQCSINSESVINKNAFLFTVLIARGDKVLSDDMKKRILSHSKEPSVAANYNSSDDYTNAKDMFVDSFVVSGTTLVRGEKYKMYRSYVDHFKQGRLTTSKDEAREDAAVDLGFNQGSYVKK